MTYSVTIEETLSRAIDIDASSADEARAKVEKMYRDEDIILDADDFTGHDITVDN